MFERVVQNSEYMKQVHLTFRYKHVAKSILAG